VIDPFPERFYHQPNAIEARACMPREEVRMRKALIVGLALLTVGAVVPRSAEAAVGIKGAFNFASWQYSGEFAPPAGYFKTLRGPIAGVFFSLSIGPVSIQPEIYYSQRGTHIAEGEDWLNYKLTYIEAPLLLKISPLPGPFSPVIFAGGYVSLLLNAKGVSMIGGEELTEDMKEFFEKNDYGLVFGGGLEFKLAVVKLIVEGRYTMGMVNIMKDVGEGAAIKNKGFSVMVGFGF
jgi:hypothetical protein